MELILALLNIIFTLFGLYFACTCSLGLMRRRKAQKTPSAPPARRIAAIIAARNEEAVIGQLVSSLAAQKYPRELFDIYVVPNNCTDSTEQAALDAGARILRCSGPVANKADALREAFRQLNGMNYDAYCIFDADNLVHPDFFQAVNNARSRGMRIAQGWRDSKNPYDNWISGCMSAFYWFMSRFYNGSRAALGMSCALNGTGFMVSADLIREIGWNTVTLTEDLEFSALCALHGVKIGWMPEARVYDEQPSTMRDSVLQRRRWSAGSLQCFRLYALRLFAKRSLHALDMGVLFTGMLLNILGIVSGVLNACVVISAVSSDPSKLPAVAIGLAVMLVLCYAAFALACMALFYLEKRLCKRTAVACLAFPFFMISWMIVNLSVFIIRVPKWDAIRHTGSHAMPG